MEKCHRCVKKSVKGTPVYDGSCMDCLIAEVARLEEAMKEKDAKITKKDNALRLAEQELGRFIRELESHIGRPSAFDFGMNTIRDALKEPGQAKPEDKFVRVEKAIENLLETSAPSQNWQELGTIMGVTNRVGVKVTLVFRTEERAIDFMKWLNRDIKEIPATDAMCDMKCAECPKVGRCQFQKKVHKKTTRARIIDRADYKLRPVKARWSDQKHQTVCGRCNAGEDLFDYHDPPLEGKYFATCRICGSRLKRK
jgi:hypothetical protein